MSVRETLQVAKAKIERGWCQGEMARTADGERVAPDSYAATRWCAAGAVCAASPVDSFHRLNCMNVLCGIVMERVITLRKTIPKNATDAVSLFNDHPETSKEDVLRVFDEAINRAKPNGK